MSYRSDFLKAFLAKKKYLPNEKPEKFFTYKDLSSFNASKDSKKVAKVFQDIDELFQDYYIPKKEELNQPIANACHLISYDMLLWMTKNHICDASDLAYTIGDVSFQGEWIYNVTEENLKETIKKGLDLKKDINVHAWLTYRTNYILDPTILFTLNDRELYDINSAENRIQLWSDCYNEFKWELNYKPLLVDSGFIHRVDTVQYNL